MTATSVEPTRKGRLHSSRDAFAAVFVQLMLTPMLSGACVSYLLASERLAVDIRQCGHVLLLLIAPYSFQSLTPSKRPYLAGGPPGHGPASGSWLPAASYTSPLKDFKGNRAI